MQFTCPKCGSHRLEELEHGQTSTPIKVIDGDHEDHEFGDPDCSNLQHVRYQCINCTFGAEDMRDLGEYMEPLPEEKTKEKEKI